MTRKFWGHLKEKIKICIHLYRHTVLNIRPQDLVCLVEFDPTFFQSTIYYSSMPDRVLKDLPLNEIFVNAILFHRAF